MDFSKVTLSDLMQMIDNGDTSGLSEILVNHKSQWNRLMEENRKLDKRIRLRNLDIENKDMTNLDLSNIDIEDSHLDGDDFSDSDLSGAHIIRSDLSDANLIRSKFDMTLISQSDMGHARLYGAEPGKLYLTGSVNLLDVYWKEKPDEEIYTTHPDIAKRDYRLLGYYEHMLEHHETEEEHEDHDYE